MNRGRTDEHRGDGGGWDAPADSGAGDRQRARRAGARRARLLVVLLVCTAGIIGYGLNAYWPRAAEDLTRTKREVDLASAGRENDLRVLVAHDTLQMARQRPLFGWGSGCFELVFPIYQGAYLRSADGRPTARFEFAHDDWLQTLAEDGAAGFILLLTPLAWLAYRAWRGTSVVGHLAILGCGLIALHAIIDFPLHNPAILLEWILMLGSVAALAPGARKSAGTAQDA